MHFFNIAQYAEIHLQSHNTMYCHFLRLEYDDDREMISICLIKFLIHRSKRNCYLLLISTFTFGVKVGEGVSGLPKRIKYFKLISFLFS